MNRIQQTFQSLARNREKALVGFVTAGDPSLDQSRNILRRMCQSGVDILEIGVPFSDPTADGPVIQRSSQRALQNDIHLETVLEMSAELRQETEIPLILFSYYNPIHALGGSRFYQKATSAGADGVLIVDLPPEESEELTAGWDAEQFSLIRLLAPTTPPARMVKIAADAAGFLYLVSMTGVTGSAGLDTTYISDFCGQVRNITPLPLCVGFGISTAEDVSRVAQVADGVVIGSAFERLIEDNLDRPDLPDIIARRVAEYKAATTAVT